MAPHGTRPNASPRGDDRDHRQPRQAGGRGGAAGKLTGRGGGRGAGGGKPVGRGGAAPAQAEPRDLAERKAALLNDGGKHLATKVSRDLTRSVAIFKAKLLKLTYGRDLDELFSYVAPNMTQHLAPEISKYRSYLSQFTRGSANHVLAFMKWYEWACFEANKHSSFNATETVKEPEGEAKTALGQLARDRKHIRSLLAMCARHNSTRRQEGLHAFLNFVQQECDGIAPCRTLEELRGSAPVSLGYALSRLVLGMATDNFANVVLHAHTLTEMLQRCPAITNSCVLSALDAELAMATRLRAAELRMKKDAANATLDANDNGDDIDPDDLADPTVGERHQKTMACLFAMGALLASGRPISASEAAEMSRLAAHCFVEHRGLRVLSGQLSLRLVQRFPVLLSDPSARLWVSHAYFKYEKIDYLRPEGLQLMIHFMNLNSVTGLPDDVARTLPSSLSAAVRRDPLEPSMLEALATALFRKEQVTACHPNVHPIWTQMLKLIEARAEGGESLKNHITNFINNVISPFRRGAVDQPRQDLFRKLVQEIGQLGLRAVDEDDRKDAVDAAAAVGFGKRMAVGKPTSAQELRALSIEEMTSKLRSLIVQYDRSLADTTPTATKVRTWILREIKAAMTVEHREGASAGYGDDVARALFRYAFKRSARRDYFNENKALYTLCDLISRSLRSGKGTIRGRELTRCTIAPAEFARMLMQLESENALRFTTASKNKTFGKARELLLAALQPDAPRSVLFYENSSMEVLLLFLLFIVSIDDPSNEVATGLAEESVTDLVTFYQTGSLTDVEVLYDVLMSLVMRPTAPMQVIPIMAALRPVAISVMLRFARLIRTRRPLDMVLQPLVDAYSTNSRELLRQQKARKLKAAEAEDADDEVQDADAPSDDEAGSDDNEEEEVSESGESDSGEEEGTEADEATDADDDDADTAEDDDDDEEEEEADDDDDADSASGSADGSFEGNDDESWASEGSDEDEDEAMADQKASPEYLKSLETMLGVDGAEAILHVYPKDQVNKEKSDVVRAITLATRIATQARTPLIIHVFQVLLAVIRENVKVDDDVVFNAAKAAMELLHRGHNRYFGHWLASNSPTMLVLLADIQSYCRKLERSLIEAAASKKTADSEEAKLKAQAVSRMRRRLAITKRLAVTTIHLVGFLAYKNHADEATRVTIAEHYRMIYGDRGWDKVAMAAQLRTDMFHFRHAFAWCFLDAIVSKWERIKHQDSPKRAMAFLGVCDAIRAMLPRFAGLPHDLKTRAAAIVCRFLTGTSLAEIYAVKHTMLYEYFGAVKMTVEYNRRVGLDTKWVVDLVNEITDKDEIQITNATARIVAQLETLLGLTERILNTKACVPRALLQKQHPTTWRRQKTRVRERQEKARVKAETAVLSLRNKEPTEDERQEKKERRKIQKRVDKTEHTRIRQMRWDKLTSEEKMEARSRSKHLKQVRIHKNRERKMRLHETRQASFKKWRSEKLQAAADADE